jgi:hypothetical protein
VTSRASMAMELMTSSFSRLAGHNHDGTMTRWHDEDR